MTRRTFLRSVGAGALIGGAAASVGLSPAVVLASPDTIVAQAGPTSAPAPTSQWDASYRSALGTTAMGYAYAVAQNGTRVAAAGVNLSRSPAEATNPSQAWTPDTLSNIFSTSKAITAVGFMELVAQQGAQLLDQTFWGILTGSGRFSGTPASGVETVTIRQLMTHFSGLSGSGGGGGPLVPAWPLAPPPWPPASG